MGHLQYQYYGWNYIHTDFIYKKKKAKDIKAEMLQIFPKTSKKADRLSKSLLG